MSMGESSSKESQLDHHDADEESLEDTDDYAEDITDDDEDDEDDEEGWITPGNIKEKKRLMNGNKPDEVQFVKVACMTTDFAMQVNFGWKKGFLENRHKLTPASMFFDTSDWRYLCDINATSYIFTFTVVSIVS